MRRIIYLAGFTALGFTLMNAAHAQEPGFSYSSYGLPGLIDMPTARSAPDAELAGTVFYFSDNTRTTISFQLTDRLSASFRYAGLEGLGTVRNTLFDRSFDLHYRIVDETRNRPAIAIGLRDFVGTGVYSSEYIVATKALSPRLTVTGGLGWGRLASSGGFTNPLGFLNSGFETRPNSGSPLGGQLEAANWFRGDAALFGGLAWQANDRLQLKLEYSSDAYVQEEANGAIDRNSQVNLAMDYKWRDGISLQAFYMYGTTLGASINFTTNPKNSVSPSGSHPAPFPVRVRGAKSARDLGWVTDAAARQRSRTDLKQAMENEGLVVDALNVTPNAVEIHIKNATYGASSEAVGRTARILTQVMPDSVETFIVVPTERGVPMSRIVLQRSDVEALEHAPNGSEAMLARAQILDAANATAPDFEGGRYPSFEWGLGPYLQTSYFDPDKPLRVGAGLQLNAHWQIARGLSLSGTLRHRLGGNIADNNRVSTSVLPKVRSEANIYEREGETALTNLTLDYYFRPGSNLYGRLSAGYLEPHFGGISGELLWKPVDSRFALGAELNLVKQRDFDQGLGFRSYEVVTGHASAYWALKNDFHFQIDAGRYLAGDWGSTFTLDREFKNGWRIGAYATFTDVSFSDFGEGSFDKGLRFTIPLEPFAGRPTRSKFNTVIQPLSRDGGARLNVNGRLYETVRDYHRQGLENSWGRFWR